MRRFVSYGPVNTKLHYYAPREELINRAYYHLVGENPGEGGHYITVWAPRQTGKTWVMQQILFRLQQEHNFDILKINLESLKDKKDPAEIIGTIARKIGEGLDKSFSGIDNQDKFQEIFKKGVIEKPLVLILDEFDALVEEGLNAVAGAFRNIYIQRLDEINKPTGQKTYLLHGVALIGVRSVLGIENETGSPFNIQRSMQIPNLTYEEVKGMFQWYEKESGQQIALGVIHKLYGETRGQPGLTGWLGELLTETYNNKKDRPITMDNFDEVMEDAINLLPSTNILNIISKANKEPYKELVLEMFKTDQLMRFTFDDKRINYLYMNGVVQPVKVEKKNYMRFASPFVQKRLFNYFSHELFEFMGQLIEPFESLEGTITGQDLNIKKIIGLYRKYLAKNSHWLFQDAPRRKDMRVFEAVFHFNIYMYLFRFIESKGGNVYPEFPTGNGKIDIVIEYKGKIYGIELKAFTDEIGYKKALDQAADYGKQLGLGEISLVFFVETIDKRSREKYEVDYLQGGTGVNVAPIFVETASYQTMEVNT